ncbi:uncharacterized protein EAE97_007159 [Botrytis byssoidea]|uniref:ornithine decarboxylase n=1 Tax=Botrytis byssoidea TaxID=139641 RepID=A0A9P5IKV4_9HELO|nr:uncharacterized protein EAE97_007159 [Botrytis byssoidea]KAF7939078.1 hypothetical protein EAE97_007159 [Botrytis byssoidea]
MSDLSTSICREPQKPAEQLLNNTIYQHIAHIEQFPHILGFNDPFFVADIEVIRRQHDLWVSHLPFVRPFYAVKCNTDNVMLRVLMQLGVGFDCASVEEMHTVLSLGAHPGSIIFANPCKAPEALAFAYNAGIRKTTFDNIDELDSINKYMPNAQLMLRIFANDNSALVALGDKYGAPLESAQALLVRAKKLGMDVVGTSFHIGSGASDPAVIRKAVQHSRLVWDIAESLGFSLRIVDIGGGFQSTESAFGDMAEAVSNAISEAGFPEQTTFIAEPGRFYARSAFTLVCKIIARRVSTTTGPSKTLEMLYQNDGVYGNFMNGLIEKEEFMPTLIKGKLNTTMARKTGNHTYKIWGPTCDSTDCVSRSTTFGCEVKIGDFLVYRNMGAYTSATATRFNGFSNQTGTIYICSNLQDYTQIEDSSSEEGNCSPMSTAIKIPTSEL